MLGGGVPGRSKVQNLYISILQYVDIIRCDIPVDNADLVHLLHGRDHLQHNIQCLIHRDLSRPGQKLLHRLAVQVLHDDVGRVVGLKAVVNVHDVRLILELGQPSGLVDDFQHSLVELLRPLSRVNRHHLLVGHTGGKFSRHILLDGHLGLQHLIVPDIGDSESAEAQHTAYDIPPRQQGTRRDVIRLLGRSPMYVPAVRTDLKLLIVHLHASHATSFHVCLLSIPVFLCGRQKVFSHPPRSRGRLAAQPLASRAIAFINPAAGPAA